MGVGPQALLSLHQIHSPDAIIVREAYGLPRPKADGIVTDRPGLAICASSADCGPVLFADSEARVIGAAHAGWKGAFTGILEATIAAMETIGAKRERSSPRSGPRSARQIMRLAPSSSRVSVADDPRNALLLRPFRNCRPCDVRPEHLYRGPAGRGPACGRGAEPLHLRRGRSLLFLPSLDAPQGAGLRPACRSIVLETN